MSQQQAPVPQASMQQQNMFGGMHGPGMAWGGQMYQQGPMFGAPVSETAQGKQRVQEAVPEFDEAAFERAFEQAHQDALESAKPKRDTLQDYAQQLRRLEQQDAARMMSIETDPVLLQIRDTRPCK